MAPIRSENTLIIYPRSQTTLVQLGLGDETFAVPNLEIPSEIYRTFDELNQCFKYHANPIESDSSCVLIKFIENGSIIDLEAFLQFIKLIYVSILDSKSKENPDTAFSTELSNIPFLLITHYTWSQPQLEKITQFIFESLKILNAMLLPSSLSTSVAMISLQNCCIIDIGKSHTDIIPIIDYTPLSFLASTLPMGGDNINKFLKTQLPSNFTDDQIESLKKSPIFEVLNDEDIAKYSKYSDISDIINPRDNAEGMDADNDGGLDVAQIIISDRDTRELLAERERAKTEKNVPNSELENNSFIDKNGDEITVGKQRFQGCKTLIEKISKRVGLVLSQIDDISKCKAAWENIVIVGGSSSIQGFKEALLTRLIKDHIVMEPENEKIKREQDSLDAANAAASETTTTTAAATTTTKGKRNANKLSGMTRSVFLPDIEYVQGPNVIRLAKYPEYFPDWKKHGYAEIPFLGGEIVTKQFFNHSRDSFYITKEKYEEKGPLALWDVEF
ncbi:Arp9p NDAI_0C00580 [Naumovozyma dairenensis CBS 421]|uniref:Actin-like protein ARP9 n=1 Tax=Naumovozyma dairenensis (strain ATCC 10597 / BCRC 20456 / CBS 421 / NBRC 0211 / NRRL Y-12639) TaxID=1071378 RepID=G0W7F8_NAUDC|nr:hypothetical protein NDAI_0C00580 [Naumovozyma dairenensis CBS 421]CCD23719.1 hypothetical protein NDAI_0C00580 [Naumovozyma dairenensis CBS 421]